MICLKVVKEALSQRGDEFNSYSELVATGWRWLSCSKGAVGVDARDARLVERG